MHAEPITNSFGRPTAWSSFSLLGLIFLCGCSPSWDILEIASLQVGQQRNDLTRLHNELAALEPRERRGAVEEVGVQLMMTPTPPPEAPWIQLDLGEVRAFDSVTLVPAILSVDAPQPTAYAFPRGFRLDVSDTPDFSEYRPIYDSGDEDFEAIDALPVVISTPDTRARYLRLTVTRLARVAERWTYALAEMIVLSGNQNVALGAKVFMQGASQLPPVWNSDYLIDGRTPLGPPIAPLGSNRKLPDFDGVLSVAGPTEGPYWMMVDLGEIAPIDEVRIHPVHARQGADYPGYAFPSSFRVEISSDQQFRGAEVLFDSGEGDYPNPGNNPITLRAEEPIEGRYVRFVCVRRSLEQRDAFGLSELEVYSKGRNIALQKPVTIPHIVHSRPSSLLVDGKTSYGTILELSDWIDNWRRTRDVTLQISDLEKQLEKAELNAASRLRWLGTLAVAISITVAGATVGERSRRRLREQRAFRKRLARDLHDEIGSNLAAIARVSEVAEIEASSHQAKSDWRSVRELALECGESMRDTLWLLGAQRFSSGDLSNKLSKIAERMLPSVELTCDLQPETLVNLKDDELLREVTLVFKEVMANIARHANATAVSITSRSVKQRTLLEIADNGVGFDTELVDVTKRGGGIGLRSIQQRMKKVRGSIDYRSRPGEGTIVLIALPNQSQR